MTQKSTGASRLRSLARFEVLAIAVPLVFMMVAFVAPLAMTLMRSVTEPSFGLGNFYTLFADPVPRRALITTVRITLEVTACCAVLGTIVALYLSRLSSTKARLVSLLVILPLWTSVLVRSFSWVVVLGAGGPVDRISAALGLGSTQPLYTEFAVVVAMTHVLLPYTVLTCKATLDQIDPSLLSAARSMGASPARAFLRVYMPLALPGVVAGSVLVAVMSFGFYITPALVGGPKQTMISTMISQQVNVTFEWGLAAAAATVLIIIVCGAYMLVRRMTSVSGLAGQI